MNKTQDSQELDAKLAAIMEDDDPDPEASPSVQEGTSDDAIDIAAHDAKKAKERDASRMEDDIE